MADLSLSQVRKSFGSVEIIKGVDLDIKHGEFIVFVGPSGCGKSTLLRLIAGLEDLSSGDIKIGNRLVNDLPPKDRSIAMVFQSYALFPHMTVRENVAFGLTISKAPQTEIDTKVAEAARMLKLEQLLDRKPSQLSGGQRQRVAIGRAIVRRPDVFLFDEPLSNLDAALRVGTRAEIAKLHRELDATMIYVTHDQVEAMTLADRIVVLEAGHVRQFGAPMELYHHPQNKFVAGFIGSPRMNFLEVTSAKVTKDSITVASNDVKSTIVPIKSEGLGSSAALTLGIRPENMTLASAKSARITGRVTLVERLGHQSYIEVETASDATCSALIEGTTDISIDQTTGLDFDPNNCHLFTPDGIALNRNRQTQKQTKIRTSKTIL
jgi:multiple sugar transport system ATP-binding protein